MTNLVCGSRSTESLIVHQPGHAGVFSTYSTAGLLWPQPDRPEPGILGVKHHQLLAAGSWHARSRLLTRLLTSEKHRVARFRGSESGTSPTGTLKAIATFGDFAGNMVQHFPGWRITGDVSISTTMQYRRQDGVRLFSPVTLSTSTRTWQWQINSQLRECKQKSPFPSLSFSSSLLINSGD